MTDWNAVAEELFGYSAAEIVDRSITLLYPAEKVSEEEDILGRVKRGEKIDAFETARRHKNGTMIPVAVTVSPIIDDGGLTVGASTIMRNLRARVDRERRLSELQAELMHVAGLSEAGQLMAPLFTRSTSL